MIKLFKIFKMILKLQIYTTKTLPVDNFYPVPYILFKDYRYTGTGTCYSRCLTPFSTDPYRYSSVFNRYHDLDHSDPAPPHCFICTKYRYRICDSHKLLLPVSNLSSLSIFSENEQWERAEAAGRCDSCAGRPLPGHQNIAQECGRTLSWNVVCARVK